MEYRLLGNSGLKVSVLSFGFWATFGLKEGVDRCVKVMRIARKGGVNFFDNAEAYGKKPGDAEIIMGQALKILQSENSTLWRRSDIVISTKIFWGGSGQNELGLSRKHIREATDACLKRLQLDYVDVLFCHRPDELTPTLEVVRGMTEQIRQGKAFYWGTSEWEPDRIVEAFWLAKQHNLIAPIVEQPEYNMFARDRFEREYRRLYLEPYRIGTTIWSPLKSGILTGKYNKKIPEGSRLTEQKFIAKRFEKEKRELVPKIEQLITYARDKLNTSVTCLAIAWCVMNPNVSTVILGATKEYQIEENLKAMEVAKRLTRQNMDDIEKILRNRPKKPMSYGRKLKTNIRTSKL